MSFDNDDDLFDYDPEEEELSSQSNVITSSLKDSFNKEEKDFVDSIKQAENTSGNINGPETKLSIAYISSSTSFINKDSSPSGHAHAVRYLLDELTDGRFSLLEYFKTTENKIYHLMAFLQLSDSIFGDNDFSFREVLNDIFDINLSDIHIRSVYHTHIAITRHSLLLNRAIYKTLSEQLNIQPISELFDDSADLDNISLSYQDTVKTVHANIINHFADLGLTDQVSEVFGLNARLSQKKDN